MSEFTPITSQDQLDTIIAKRVKEEKALAEEVENLKTQLESKEEEISTIKREHFQEAARRDVRAELARRGVEDEGRIQRVMKMIDFSEASDSSFALAQVDAVAGDIPELVRPRGAGSGGSKYPVLQQQEKPLTEEDIAKMTPEEMAKPGIMERIDKFMSGQRN